MPDSNKRWLIGRHAVATAIASGMLVMATACSDDPLTQAQARDRAASALCDWESRCARIGPPPAPHLDRDACLTSWKGTVQTVWPPADCTHISRAEFDSCIVSIGNTACANGIDWLSILTKCAKMEVCGTP